MAARRICKWLTLGYQNNSLVKTSLNQIQNVCICKACIFKRSLLQPSFVRFSSSSIKKQLHSLRKTYNDGDSELELRVDDYNFNSMKVKSKVHNLQQSQAPIQDLDRPYKYSKSYMQSRKERKQRRILEKQNCSQDRKIKKSQFKYLTVQNNTASKKKFSRKAKYQTKDTQLVNNGSLPGLLRDGSLKSVDKNESIDTNQETLNMDPGIYALKPQFKTDKELVDHLIDNVLYEDGMVYYIIDICL